MSLSIIIPIKNEEENISIITERLSKLNIEKELCFVDDFSSDRSFEKILKLKNNFDFVKVIKNKKPGLGSAINEGDKKCQQKIYLHYDV